MGYWGGEGGWVGLLYFTQHTVSRTPAQAWNAERGTGTKNDITIPQDSTLVCCCHRFRLFFFFFFLLSPPPLQRVGETVITAHSQVCLGEAPFPPPSSVRCRHSDRLFPQPSRSGKTHSSCSSSSSGFLVCGIEASSFWMTGAALIRAAALNPPFSIYFSMFR